jgi:hypothetical protein
VLNQGVTLRWESPGLTTRRKEEEESVQENDIGNWLVVQQVIQVEEIPQRVWNR